MAKYIRSVVLVCILVFPSLVQASLDQDTVKVFTFEMKQMVDKGLWRLTEKAHEDASEWGADLILIHMNTYGGLVDMADSIRTKILNSDIPYWVFIDNNAASAGALISIACDSIYMRPGGNIGAATVVNQSGEQQPDKYQSYMRSTMRSTAEAKGKDTVLINGEKSYTWRRDPAIAEAMVDPALFVPLVSDTGKVLTFTPTEAINWGFCEATANSIEDVIAKAGIEVYEIKEYKQSGLDKFIGFLLSPAIQGLLILLIVGGIYFELQTPGIGFAIAAAAVGALLYFAPLYIEGLAENWEIIIFVAGILLVLVEIFAIPGFGVAGVSGIILLISGLALSLVENVAFDFTNVPFIELFKAFAFVIFAFFVSLLGSILVGQKLLTSSPLSFMALNADQKKAEGWVSSSPDAETLVGQTGVAYTILRPSGRVMIENQVYDAVAESSWIDKGTNVKVVRQGTTQLYVRPVESNA